MKGGNGVENGIEGDGAAAYALSHKRRTASSPTISGGNRNGNGNGGGRLVREGGEEDDLAATTAKKRKQRRRIFQSFPNTPIPSQYGGSEPSDSEDEDEEDEEWGAQRGVGRRFVDGVESSRMWRTVRRWSLKMWRPVKRMGKKVGAFVSFTFFARRNDEPDADRRSQLRSQMTVPLWAALLSLVVACIPPLQHVLNEAEPLKA